MYHSVPQGRALHANCRNEHLIRLVCLYMSASCRPTLVPVAGGFSSLGSLNWLFQQMAAGTSSSGATLVTPTLLIGFQPPLCASVTTPSSLLYDAYPSWNSTVSFRPLGWSQTCTRGARGCRLCEASFTVPYTVIAMAEFTGHYHTNNW